MVETTNNVDQAKDLLLALLPGINHGDLSKDEYRKAILEAASLSLRLLVDSSDTAPMALEVSEMRYVKLSSLKKAKKFEFAKALIQSVSNKKPSVVGFHVIDPEIGRYSQIWIPPSRLCPLLNGGGETQQNWWQAYPTLWLRVYKQFLHPSTSLLNAYRRKLLKFQDTSLLIHWSNESVQNFNGTIVSLALNCLEMGKFVKSTTKILKQLHNILLKHTKRITSKQKEEEIQRIIEDVGLELKDNNLIDNLTDIRTEYLHAVIKEGTPRKKFLSTLKDLGGRDGNIFCQLEENKYEGKWYGETRKKAIEGIEILQTILFNAPAFCSKHGFSLHRKKIDASLVSIILGRDGIYELNKVQCLQVKNLFDLMMTAIDSILDCNKYKERKKGSLKSNPIVDEVLNQLEISNSEEKTKIEFFLIFAWKLSLEAIHEGRELSFLLGFGHAEEPEIRCRNPIRLPKYLSQEGADLGLLVHFVKSYFSLFGDEDRILWFNQYARCQGLYERAPEDPKERWLEDWPEACYFVRIKGKGQLDVLKQEITGAFKKQHRPRIRIKDDNVVNLKSLTDIQYRVFLATTHVFQSHPSRAQWVMQLIAKVVDRLREAAHGAGLVVVNKDIGSYSPGNWRISINNQVKPLVPELERFRSIEETLKENGNELNEHLINEICLLAELDGAVYLVFKDEKMCAYPARHFSPLVNENKQSKNNLQLLDFYKWTEKGRKKHNKNDEKIKKLFENLNSEFKNINDVDINKLGTKSEFEKEFKKRVKDLKPFDQIETLKLYTACIRGSIELKPENVVPKAIAELSFLTSSGTRHHSLWGITLSSKQRLFVVSLSQDGRVSVFWDGRLIPSFDKQK